jgi:hypothetical protein
MEGEMSDDDAKLLTELGRDLPSIDVDEQRAQRMVARTRQHVGRGSSPLRWVEPVAVALLVTSVLVWALVKLFEILG